MRKLFGLATIVLFTAALGLAGQAKQHNDAFTAGPQNESDLARKIRHELVTLPYYSIFTDLAFKVDNGVVTLEGACPPDPPYDIKKDAENVVKRIPGVTQVVNNIKELPLSNMDWQIRRAMVKAIYGDAQIGDRYGYQALPSIHIIVDNGHVTLTGFVATDSDKNLAGIRASGAGMNFGVTNNLQVEHNSKNG